MKDGAWLRAGFGVALACATLAGCGTGPNGVTEGSGSTATAGMLGAGTSGTVATNGGASSGAAGTAGAGEAAPACPEAREPLRVGGTVVELSFAPSLGGKPFVVGEPNPMAGGQVSPLNLRFYVSEPSLVAADGTSLAVDLVSSSGQPEPYGVHLVNFEDPASTSIRFLAPPGSYAGARFTFGINDACNNGDASRSAPLSVNSQMVWPHFAGFLFLRYEAQWLAEPGAVAATAPPPSMIHMGGVVGSVFAPQVTVAGALTVPATGAVTRKLDVSFDEIFRGASSADDVSDLPLQGPEVVAGERLRRAAPTLAIFKLAEP